MFKVLIVEDETLVARMQQKMTKGSDFEVEVAIDGIAGIKKAKEWQPDVILMDIMMPETNGLQALEKLKNDPDTKNIPVVILTNLSGKHDAKLAISRGAEEFWVKKDLDPKSFKKNLLAILEK